MPIDLVIEDRESVGSTGSAASPPNTTPTVSHHSSSNMPNANNNNSSSGAIVGLSQSDVNSMLPHPQQQQQHQQHHQQSQQMTNSSPGNFQTSATSCTGIPSLSSSEKAVSNILNGNSLSTDATASRQFAATAMPQLYPFNAAADQQGNSHF